MANRMLRDTTDSERINILTADAEVFFYRLMMKADDYGNYHANIKLIKANCYPFKADVITDDFIAGCINELSKAGLIKIYWAESKQYLNILNFGQRLRNKKKKFPDCPEEPQQETTRENPPPSAAICPSELEVEIEEELETEQEAQKPFFKEEIFLVPEMMKEWKAIFKNYPDKKENDFPALREIAEFLANKEKIELDTGIMPFFKQLSEYIFKHDFYKNYSLLQVSRHIQNIVNNINNNGHANNSASSKSNRDKQADASQKLVDKLRSVTGTG